MRAETSSILLTAALLFAGGCQAELASALEEEDADAVVLALHEAGIAAEKERAAGDARFGVNVARADLGPALAVLRDADLPRERAPGFAELFAERGLVPSAADERARFAAATAGELARSIETMDGVTRARVHLALPDPSARLLDEGAPPARASVLIGATSRGRVDRAAVQALVAGAVPNLRAEDVAIVETVAGAPAPREPSLVMLGPIAVASSSAELLKAVLGGSLLLNLLLAAALVLARARRRLTVSREPAAARASARETISGG